MKIINIGFQENGLKKLQIFIVKNILKFYPIKIMLKL